MEYPERLRVHMALVFTDTLQTQDIMKIMAVSSNQQVLVVKLWWVLRLKAEIIY